MRSILIPCLTLIASASAAHATTLAAGGMFASPLQDTAVCYIYNSGSIAASISEAKIIQQFIGAVPLTINQCGASLAPGAICGIAAHAANNAPYACKFVISNNAEGVRGQMELRNGLTALKNLELR